MPLFPLGLRETARELLWPTRCVSCELPGELLCDECRANMPWIDQRWACPVCGAPYGWLTCTECKHDPDWTLDACVCACTYEGPAARLVTTLKDSHELRLAPIVAAAMTGALEEAEGWQTQDNIPRIDLSSIDALCFVPATAAAYARRGFDHMELISRHLALLTDIPLADILVREQASDQRKLTKEAREENLANTIRATDDVTGMHILVADDVLTTGATINEAARALKTRGAARVSGCALARVW